MGVSAGTLRMAGFLPSTLSTMLRVYWPRVTTDARLLGGPYIRPAD